MYSLYIEQISLRPNVWAINFLMIQPNINLENQDSNLALNICKVVHRYTVVLILISAESEFKLFMSLLHRNCLKTRLLRLMGLCAG